jgi:hypothetical protein
MDTLPFKFTQFPFPLHILCCLRCLTSIDTTTTALHDLYVCTAESKSTRTDTTTPITMPQPPQSRHPINSDINPVATADRSANISSSLDSGFRICGNSCAKPRAQGAGPTTRDVSCREEEESVQQNRGPDTVATPETQPLQDERPAAGFDGPDDARDPLNWPATKKWGMVMLVSALTFLTPLASSMFAPAVPEVMDEFGSASDMLRGFMVSVYILGFALGPMGTCVLRCLVCDSCFFFLVFADVGSCRAVVRGVWAVAPVSRLRSAVYRLHGVGGCFDEYGHVYRLPLSHGV